MSLNNSSDRLISFPTWVSIFILVLSYFGTGIWMRLGNDLLISFIITIPLNFLGLIFGLRSYKKIGKSGERNLLVLINWLHAVWVSMNVFYLGSILFVAYFGRQIFELLSK